MSMITRCPACGTMFKVVPDQLRISEGWVRCGHCADVFDARAHLQQQHEEVPPPLEPARPAEPETIEADVTARDSESFVSSLVTEVGEAMPSQAPDSAHLEAEAQGLQEHPLDRPFELRREDVVADEPAQALPRHFLPAEPASEPDPALHDLSFVRQARRQKFWARPRVRALLGLALVALVLLLGLQLALHDRDLLAAANPALRPWLAALCEPLECRLRPPRQIEALAIESSTFSKLRDDTYRLNVTLKNQAAVQVAMPALELTLTDAQDQAVVRRVLLPAELGPNPGVIAAASEWSGSMAFAVAANGNGSRISGYRVLAFYP